MSLLDAVYSAASCSAGKVSIWVGEFKQSAIRNRELDTDVKNTAMAQ